MRRATRELRFGEATIRPGESVWLVSVSASHDESHFEDPNVFDVRRANASDHLAFGRGRHFCMGAPLARLETPIAVSATRAPTRLSNWRGQPMPCPTFVTLLYNHLHVEWKEHEGAVTTVKRVSFCPLLSRMGAGQRSTKAAGKNSSEPQGRRFRLRFAPIRFARCGPSISGLRLTRRSRRRGTCSLRLPGRWRYGSIGRYGQADREARVTLPRAEPRARRRCVTR